MIRKIFIKFKNKIENKKFQNFNDIKKFLNDLKEENLQIKSFNSFGEENIIYTKKLKNFDLNDFELLLLNKNYFIKCYTNNNIK